MGGGTSSPFIERALSSLALAEKPAGWSFKDIPLTWFIISTYREDAILLSRLYFVAI